MSDDLLKMFSEPLLTVEEIDQQQMIALVDAELARLPVDMPKHMKVLMAMVRGIERHLEEGNSK